MKLLILGVAGTFMAGVATLARQLGHDVSGVDQAMYPPMSDYLREQGIVCHVGYSPEQLTLTQPDLVVIGNAMSRGNPLVEAVLNQGVPYTSGPAWLAEQVLQSRRVLAVAGTHGKTTTSSMLTWILQQAGLQPGFLIGGLSSLLKVPADLGRRECFVIEADEYDTAFWDKRSKFMHYRPEVLLLNNLEFDHADIFPDLEAIKRQFGLLLRTVPERGQIICPTDDANIESVLAGGCWTPRHYWRHTTSVPSVSPTVSQSAQLQLLAYQQGGRTFTFQCNEVTHTLTWTLLGLHNIANALAAMAGAAAVGVSIEQSIAALQCFHLPKRRLEVRGCQRGVQVIDDFAHHPTAILATLRTLRDDPERGRVIAILEFGSNTMQAGYHAPAVLEALQQADLVFLKRPAEVSKPLAEALQHYSSYGVYEQVADIVEQVAQQAQANDTIVVMSNKGFENIHERLLAALQAGSPLPATQEKQHAE